MISASIVLYNTPKEQTEAVLHSVLGSSCVSTVYIIDNSPNDSRRILERRSSRIRYIHNANLGYGAGHNLALREAIEAQGLYHAVLNPDVRFDPAVLNTLAEVMEARPSCVYLLPRVIYPDGSLQRLCKLLPTPFDLIGRRFFPPVRFIKRLNERYELVHSGYNQVMNPPCLSGCFMFLRLSALKEHELFFDERFFMYCEDFDLIRRLHRIGETLYYPELTIIHDHGQASYKNLKQLKQHIISACKYFCKYGWFIDRERKSMNRQILEELKDLSSMQP